MSTVRLPKHNKRDRTRGDILLENVGKCALSRVQGRYWVRKRTAARRAGAGVGLWIFISYASEDRNAVAYPLQEAVLREASVVEGCRVVQKSI